MKKELFRTEIRSVEISVGWSILLSLFFLGFSPVSLFFYIFLILAHEIGHAFMCRIFHIPVHAIEINITGGKCYHSGYATDFQSTVISWGGVIFQGVILAVAGIVYYFLNWYNVSEENIFYFPVLYVLIILNIFLIVINILPVKNYDGVQAWRIFSYFKIPFKFKKLQRKNKSLKNKNNVIDIKNYLQYKNQIDGIFDSIQQEGWESLSAEDKLKLEEAREGVKRIAPKK
ncbi:MAG: M50 family metallopeptidase [Spirochaetes bacterium]|nr:M50 family metallopeptidase [Spirochaetota bacterium]